VEKIFRAVWGGYFEVVDDATKDPFASFPVVSFDFDLVGEKSETKIMAN
jgi:hypothetical protein